MAYGTVKVDNVTFTYNAADATTTFSGFYASTTNNLTLSGTASANTFTGTTANFTNANTQNINVTTLLSGLAITGGTAGFTSITGITVTGTTANFVTVSGTTVTGTTANFVTVSGTTVTGTTANFVTVSGTTVTGTTASFTSGVFTNISGTTATFTSGIIASGTNALPSLAFLSDPDTGIYSPGANQLAVATSGTGKLFVDANGNFGVGTANPKSILTTQGNIVGLSETTHSLQHYQQASSIYTATSIDSVLSGASGFLVFKTGTNWTNGNAIEQARIRSDGMFEVKGAGTAGSSPAFSVNGSAPADSAIIDSSGRLGIGTSGPSERLDLGGGVSDTVKIRFSMGGNVGTIGSVGSGVANGLGNLTFFTRNGSSEVAAMTIDGSQRVGIGPTSPGSWNANYNGPMAVIGSTSNSACGLVLLSSTAGNSRLDFSDGTGAFEQAVGSLVYSHSSNSLTFNTDSSPRVTIDSSGRLLVGTITTSTNTNTKLVIQQNNAPRPTGGPEAGLFLTTSSNGYALQAGAYDSGSLATSYTWISSVRSNDAYYDGPALPPLVFLIANQECMRIKSDGDVSIVTGNLIIGTAGKGIDFSADGSAAGMTSELLDDYEEGTFTPTVLGSTTAGIGTYTSRNGKYTKIGNTVYFLIDYILSAHTGTGDTLISGLPFTSGNLYFPNIVVVASNLSLTALYYIGGSIISNGDTKIYFQQMPVGGGTAIGIAIDGVSDVRLSGFYFV